MHGRGEGGDGREFYLHSKIAKLGVVLPLLLMAVWYLWWNVNDYRAFLYSKSRSIAGLETAARLQPSNALYERFLGEYLWYLHDWQAAIVKYKAAIALDPQEPRTWLDLAAAYQFAGDHKAEAGALATALRLDPTSPATALEAATFYLVMGDVDDAIRAFRTTLNQSNNPEQVTLALDRSWRATGDIDKLLAELVPPTPTAHLALLRMLVSSQESAAAARVWSHLVSLHIPFDSNAAFGYLDYLIGSKQVDEAQQVWHDLLDIDSLEDYASTQNLVVNGGFEKDPLNGGFDWRYIPLSQVRAEIDTSEFHGGSRALLASFDGQPIAEIGVYQWIPVQPNTQYKFRGFMKTVDIEGGSGPRFIIADAYTNERYLMSDDLLGSSVWHEDTGEFRTGPTTRLLRLTILRSPSNSPIRGKVWIDDVTLVPQT